MIRNTITYFSIGVCFDPELLNHFCLWDPKFPENPKRLNATVQRCKELELWDKCQQIPVSQLYT